MNNIIIIITLSEQIYEAAYINITYSDCKTINVIIFSVLSIGTWNIRSSKCDTQKQATFEKCLYRPK